MSDIVPFPKGRGTPASLIQQLAQNDDEIMHMVAIVFKKTPDGEPGAVKAYWSDMNTMELAFAGTVLDWEIKDVMDENVE